MNERIIAFIEGQKAATICCVDENNQLFCFSCFYVFDRAKKCFYFKSSVNTQHGPLLLKSPRVAGTIQPDKLNLLAIKGVQFHGVIIDRNDPLASDAISLYHKKYPFALTMQGEVWTVQLQQIKMTDNTLNFGKKLTWQLEAATVE